MGQGHLRLHHGSQDRPLFQSEEEVIVQNKGSNRGGQKHKGLRTIEWGHCKLFSISLLTVHLKARRNYENCKDFQYFLPHFSFQYFMIQELMNFHSNESLSSSVFPTRIFQSCNVFYEALLTSM